MENRGMDFQMMINNAMAAHKAERLANSEQLTLGELILKLEAVQDKTKKVVFDFGDYAPTSIGSWRGSYSELALSYTNEGRMEGGYAHTDSCAQDEWGYKCDCKPSDTFMDKPTVAELLAILNDAMGKAFVGYKGGDFKMHKRTSIWVANYSDSSLYLPEYKGVKGEVSDWNKEGHFGETVNIVDVIENDCVILVTQQEEY